jgi:hypothetical protein
MLFDDEEPSEDAPYPASVSAPPLAPTDSYRPDMLPRSHASREPQTAPPQTSLDSRLEALRREMRREETTSQRPVFSQDPAASPHREPGMSLRESILKKPLRSLHNKD